MLKEGTITFNTELDNSQLEKDYKEASKKIERLEKEASKQEQNKNELAEKMKQAGSEAEETRKKISELNDELKKQQAIKSGQAKSGEAYDIQEQIALEQARIEELTSKSDQLAQGYTGPSEGPEADALDQKLDEINSKIVEARQRVSELNDQLNNLPSGPEAEVQAMTEAGERVSVITHEIRDQESTLRRQEAAYNRISERLNTVTAREENITSELNAARARASDLQTQLNSGLFGAGFDRAMDGARRKFDKLFTKIGTQIKRVFFFSIILSGLRAIKSYFSEIISQNNEASRAIGSLKGSLQALAQPIVGAVLPAFTKFVNILSVLIGYLARAVNKIFGTTIDKSIASAKAIGKQSKSIKEVGKEAKAASRYLAGFDELVTQPGRESDGGNSSIGDISGDGTTGTEPNWDAFDASKVDKKLQEIAGIIGASLLAVGAILAFSGINIPLGITLMAIGAALMYEALGENWNELPDKVRESITSFLVISGIILVALGAVLAFSGVNIFLGIGLMASGLAMLYEAASLNWNSMSQQLQSAITSALLIVGITAVVIGSVLAFSGVNIPLGVGLILLGITSIASSAALNWNTMNDELRKTITGALVISGVIAIVLGCILAFTGAGIPLGVALISIGAASIVSASALNWSYLNPILSGSINEIIAIAGAASLALGLILVFTGVGVGVGVALILAGTGALAGEAAINWGFLKEKFQEIWSGIVSWYKSTVAPIFTVEWWANKFASIADGLKSALKAGINTAIALMNKFSSAINDRFSFSWDGFSIGGKQIIDSGSFQLIKIPQIPQLAQGAVIPPNREFLATLGDQSNGTNLEAPESLIRKIVREESGSSQTTELLMKILAAVENGHILMVDKRVLGRVAREQIANMERMGG